MTTTPRPPWLALALLSRFVPEQEALIGDLLEEYAVRRSRLWFWRQTVAAIVLARRASRRQFTIVRLSDKLLPVRYEEVHFPIRLSASPFPIAGGLGIASLGAVVAMYRPGMWWFVALAIVGGIALGVIKVVLTRRRFRADRDAFIAQHGMRFR